MTSLTWARRIPDSLVSTRGNRSAFFGVSTRRNETIWDSTVPCKVYHEYVVRTKWLLAKSFTLLELIGPRHLAQGPIRKHLIAWTRVALLCFLVSRDSAASPARTRAHCMLRS